MGIKKGVGAVQGYGDWPLPAFYFSVSISGCADDTAFQEISGLELRIETEEYSEGGNNLVYHLPKSIKNSNLILKRAVTEKTSKLLIWCLGILNGQLSKPISTKSVSINLLNENGVTCKSWTVSNAYPVKLKVEPFNSTKNDVAIEEIEICFNRLERNL
ncbi:phage tail protein [Pectobacterium polaris]|uniref:Phage tail protein n=1 Tax=Pectobacterium polaris TaxID=2042057 RepID=A0AAW5GBJ9_9GAMM|nr:phage tail protein [Pectobacterium polaris]MCL6350635.1 phage tail protein [Pectobacterium polaris]MCL6368033.1 phage tail protein [Pectobacterium polaris]